MGSAVFISDPNHEFDLTVVLGPGGGLPFKRDGVLLGNVLNNP